jgi:hypothetical protein
MHGPNRCQKGQKRPTDPHWLVGPSSEVGAVLSRGVRITASRIFIATNSSLMFTVTFVPNLGAGNWHRRRNVTRTGP